MVPLRLHERRACQFPPSCSRSSPPPSSSCRPMLFMYKLGMLAPGNRFRSILPTSITAHFDSVAFGHFHSIFSCLGAASVPRRCRRHDGADPISFRIKHRFIIARLLRPRPPATIGRGRRTIGRKLLRLGIPAGKMSRRRRAPRARACLLIRKERRRARKEEGRADLVEISFVP